jgi:hypothetical protein
MDFQILNLIFGGFFGAVVAVIFASVLNYFKRNSDKTGHNEIELTKNEIQIKNIFIEVEELDKIAKSNQSKLIELEKYIRDKYVSKEDYKSAIDDLKNYIVKFEENAIKTNERIQNHITMLVTLLRKLAFNRNIDIEDDSTNGD